MPESFQVAQFNDYDLFGHENMEHKDRYKIWEKELTEFLDAPEMSPPAAVSQRIKEKVESSLHPSAYAVFFKLVGIVLVAGSASLIICPQLGFGSDIGIMRFFMSLGPLGCKAACGGFFMLSSVLVACTILRPEELRVLRRTKFLSVSALSALALGAFLCASPEVLEAAALTWFFGASFGGILSLELGYRAKVWFLTQRYAETS